MKTISSYLLLLMLTVSFASVLEDIDKTSLGKTLLDTLAIQLGVTSEPLDRLYDTLYDLEDRLIAD
jgi:hypothetical protein